MIDVSQLTRRFGGVTAVQDVSFHVAAGETVGLIGPNGAGKSTLLALLGGQIAPQEGEILLEGRRVDGLPAHRLQGHGMTRTFQIPRPFRRLTVLENLLLAEPGDSLVGALRRRQIPAATAERAERLLRQVKLDLHRDAPAGELSGGQHKLLELARALMAEPRVILLDEPCAGLHPEMIDFLSETITRLHDEGMTFVIVEHNIGFILRQCSRVIVMAQGRVIMDAPPETVRHDRRVLDIFLGQDA